MSTRGVVGSALSGCRGRDSERPSSRRGSRPSGLARAAVFGWLLRQPRAAWSPRPEPPGGRGSRRVARITAARPRLPCVRSTGLHAGRTAEQGSMGTRQPRRPRPPSAGRVCTCHAAVPGLDIPPLRSGRHGASLPGPGEVSREQCNGCTSHAGAPCVAVSLGPTSASCTAQLPAPRSLGPGLVPTGRSKPGTAVTSGSGFALSPLGVLENHRSQERGGVCAFERLRIPARQTDAAHGVAVSADNAESARPSRLHGAGRRL